MSVGKLPKSAESLLNNLINPGLRFFKNMESYSNDAPYFLLPSSEKLGTFKDRFLRKCPKNPNFGHLIPLNPRIKIVFKISAVSLSLQSMRCLMMDELMGKGNY